MANKDTSKQWFETGDYPTQAQFYQVFEWLRWKDEALAITDIDGLQAILNLLSTAPVEVFTQGPGWNSQYTVPAGYLLEKIIVVPVVDAYPYASYVPGATGDIIPLDMTTIVTSAGAVWVVNIFAAVARTIEIGNMPNTSKVYFIKRKIV